MPTPTLQIVLGSTRPGRLGLPVAEWLRTRAEQHGGFTVELIDLAEVALPFLDEPELPRTGIHQHEHTKRWSATISRGDAFVFVTPEYNHGPTAVLKNAIDFLFAEWHYKPVGFVSYGGPAGGVRAVQMLKQFVSPLKMHPMGQAVLIPFIEQQIEDGALRESEFMGVSADAMLDELVRWSTALGELRTSS